MGRYLRVLRRPGAAVFSAAAVVGRLPIAMLALALVFLVRDVTGSYAAAGAVAAAAAGAQAAGLPLLGRLADQHGQSRVLLPALAVHLAGLGVLTAGGLLSAPLGVLVVGALLAGVALPPLGSLVRARWAAVVPPAELPVAFALEATLDELVFVLGPLLVTALAVGVDPVAGIAGIAVPVTVGTLVFAAQHATAPPAVRLVPGAPRRAGMVRSIPGMRVLVLAMVALGAVFGSLEVAEVAATEALGKPAAAGLVLALVAGCSGVSGLAYGAVHWRTPLAVRFPATLGALAAAAGLLLLLPGSLLGLAAASALLGLAIAPSLVAGFQIAEALAPPGGRTEAIAWGNTAITLGVAGGAATSGPLIEAAGPRGGLALVLGAAVVAAAVAWAGAGQLRPARQSDGDLRAEGLPR